MATPDPRPLRGITLIVLAMTAFTAMSAFVKAAEEVPAGQAMFFRSLFALPVVLGWLVMTGQLANGLKTRNPRGHIVRSVAGTAAMGLGFAGLKYLPLPEVTALRFITPVLIVIFAAVLLGERFRLIRLSAVIAGLLGVLIIMWPRLTFDASDGALFGVAVTLASAGLAALAQIFVKSMTGRETTASIVFYFTVSGIFASLVTAPFGWVWPSLGDAAFLIGTGLVGGIGQLCVTLSYRYAEASTLAPFTYVTMIWSIIVGYVFFAEVPTTATLLGAALIMAAGAVIAWRERQLGLKQATEGKVVAKGMQ